MAGEVTDGGMVIVGAGETGGRVACALREQGYEGVDVRLLDDQGAVLETAETDEIFTNPKDERTQGYITGRYG